MPPLDLGMFEGHRAFIGWGLLALGIAALLSSVAPKARRKPKGPPLVDFDAAPDVTSVSDHHEDPAHHDSHEHHEEGHHDDGHGHEPHGDAHGRHVSSSGSPRPSALW
jgi:ABC-type nickel/cobalt efflux system permease component RcnA